MKNPYDLNTSKEKSESPSFASRRALCGDLTELILTRSRELANVGFSLEMARFDCLITMKTIVDGLYDEFNVGNARKEWYRELVRVGFKNTSSD